MRNLIGGGAASLETRPCCSKNSFDRTTDGAPYLEVVAPVVVPRKRAPHVRIDNGNALRFVLLQQKLGDPARWPVGLAVSDIEVEVENSLDSRVAFIVRNS